MNTIRYNGNQPINRIALNPPKIEYKETVDENGDITYASALSAKLTAKLIDAVDETITDAIIKECAAEGVTDLFLIDKEFILSAIKNEMIRRKGETERDSRKIQQG